MPPDQVSRLHMDPIHFRGPFKPILFPSAWNTLFPCSLGLFSSDPSFVAQLQSQIPGRMFPITPTLGPLPYSEFGLVTTTCTANWELIILCDVFWLMSSYTFNSLSIGLCLDSQRAETLCGQRLKVTSLPECGQVCRTQMGVITLLSDFIKQQKHYLHIIKRITSNTKD